MAISPIASTRSGPGRASTGTNIPDYLQGLQQYAIPNVDSGATSASSMVADPAQANISSAPALEKISNLISQINQQSYLSAPGRQQELANIQRWQAGELDPSVYADSASRAAQLYGGGGFGVDSPAWQASVQRALATNRQALQEKGATALEQLYKDMPVTDVSKYTVTPSEYAAAQNAQAQRALQAAQLQQTGALRTAELSQARALAEQELAYKNAALAQEKALREAENYAKYGYRGLGAKASQDFLGNYLADLRANWGKYGYSGPPVVRF